MESHESEALSADTFSFGDSLQTVADPYTENDGVDEPALRTSAVARPECVGSMDSNYRFSEEQIRTMRIDDAMAGGMVAMIIATAFVVFLFLAIGVNIWMQNFSQ